MMETEELSLIVEKLNEKLTPEQEYTLVSLDELEGEELTQLLFNVLSLLNSSFNIDVTEHQLENLLDKTTEFLIRTCNYKGKDFNEVQEGISQADKEIIFPVLFYLMNNFSELQQRVYLSRFLDELQIPDMFFSDPEINEMHQEYKDLMDEFKNIHHDVNNIRKAASDPKEISKRVSNLDSEKDRLSKKISSVSEKLKNTEDKDQFLELVKKIRKEREYQSKQDSRLKNQQNILRKTNEKLDEILKMKKQTQSEYESGLEGLVDKYKKDVENLKNLLEEKYQSEMNQLKKKINHMGQVVYEPYDKEQLEKELNEMQSEVTELAEKHQRMRAEKEQPEVRNLQFKKVHLDHLAKAKEKKEKTIDSLEQKKDSIYANKMQKEKELSKLRNEKTILKGEELKRYSQSVRGKKSKYQKLRTELSEMQSEHGVLSRTEDILASQLEEVQTRLNQLEEEKGISGYRRTQYTLEDVSMEKSNIDKKKGKTLEEISEIVTEINEKIQAEKERLAPKFKELQRIRDEHKEIEKRFNEKKNNYQNALTSFETENVGLKKEVEEKESNFEQTESLYHDLNLRMEVLEAKKQRIDDENRFKIGEDRLSRDFSTYTERLKTKIRELEHESKELRDRQRDIKDNFEDSQRQIQLFDQLNKLLEGKVRAKQNESHSEELRGHTESDGFGVDRLVL
eukprot:gb/GECH01002805.1/.p1 GENE.gb/GECH01002805.1/~~gb/GECH01002805.1/.p1  ORF type:complete len:680 (+),score=221.75 gb/GECH01002805.1/:1-2040(+)